MNTQAKGGAAATGRHHAMTRFWRQEDGTLLPLGMIMLMLMVLIGGLAIDIMRHEEKRVLLQQTLDRSVLAAANLNQTLDATAVVEDYFDKAGISEYLSGVTVDEGINFRVVNAEAKADTNPFFMHLMGIDEFNVAADSGAEERISNVEVSLVLDISGSMDGSRINNLRPAARDFVDTILANSEPGKATISIIPYSAQVNLGKPLMDQFNVADLHTNSYCMELPDSAFTTTGLSRTTAYIHNGHFDPFAGTSTAPSTFNCTHHAANQVLALSDSATALKGKINGLVVGGNTSIDLGVKWGALLLDPTAGPVIDGLINQGKVSAAYSDRPLQRDTGDTLKVLVVMTDGENTTEYTLTSAYRSGSSNVWRSSGGTFYAFHDRSNTSSDYYNISTGNWSTKPSGVSNWTWPQVFTTYSVNYVAYNFFARPLGQSTSTWFNNITDSVSSTKNSRMQQVCTAAKSAGIVVYGIAFEAPSNGRVQIQNCATSDAHYFSATGLEIQTVFRSIANQISYLRLTQ
ncbi:VWA domain-containing protein [Gemmobacter fulvus]|uniref:VWA domain-containing protein n=1 Tax=Gemmobacter fulvus TaxID=2840474 RepID=A0A975P9Z9_9RHOB|nr:VWA domain-containing protein [Gemmobacter fulvus]MBT9244310.1 VWA domain-containing protein [Gemmobacter fulvus]QWK91196.1 VWA domain-containing protein [Gemmobacter fulvus]